MKDLLRKELRAQMKAAANNPLSFQKANQNLLHQLHHFLTSDRRSFQSPAPLRLGLYWPMLGEVDTRPYWRRWIEEGFELYLPTILPHQLMCFGKIDENLILFYENRIALTERYEKLWKDLIQVRPTACEALTQPIDFIHVPGLAFTKEGLRLGQGGGYYDRYLSRFSKEQVVTVSTAFSFQIKESLPHEPWDVRMQNILIESP